MMIRKIDMLFLCLLMLFTLAEPVAAGSLFWQKRQALLDIPSGLSADMEIIAGNAVIFAHGGKVFLWQEDPESLTEVLQLSRGNLSVNDIFADPVNPGVIYAATDEGLFMSRGGFHHWDKIYNVHNIDEESCQAVLATGDRIYLGTKSGLFYQEKNGGTWDKVGGEISGQPVRELALLKGKILVVTDRELFQGDIREEGRFQKVFGVAANDGEEIQEESFESGRPLIRRMLPIVGEEPLLILATTRGISRWHQATGQWENVPALGLPLPLLRDLIYLKTSHNDMVFLAATDRGAFILRQDRWQPIYQGLETNQVLSLAVRRDNQILALTESGLFSMDLGYPGGSYSQVSPEEKAQPGQPSISGLTLTFQKVREHFAFEPSITEVHRWAIRYADVGPEKIQRWYRESKAKAWLPDVSVGIDMDNNRTISDSVWGSYTSGGQVYIGPDDKTVYDNTGFGISLSWDLADLVWSSDQTSIDSRSKLMAELREDILDQTTRIYFERRRNQIELMRGTDEDPRLRLETEMRIAELTALIDALTGGEFSRGIGAGQAALK